MTVTTTPTAMVKTEVTFRISVEPTATPNIFAISVADIPVSRIVSDRPIEALRADYQLPMVWLRYMNGSIHPELMTRDADFEIVAHIAFLASGLSGSQEKK